MPILQFALEAILILYGLVQLKTYGLWAWLSRIISGDPEFLRPSLRTC
jgi:hypothetical protein